MEKDSKAGVVPGALSMAVARSSIEEVVALLRAGANPDDRDDRGECVLMIAAVTDQFRIANLLLDFGADIWVADKFGLTPAGFAYSSNVLPDSIEGMARSRFIERLRAAAYPWPPPESNLILELRAAGQWPPSHSK